MPSFDVVSEVDKHEVTNAIDQANREVGTRFDFKGTGAEFEYKDDIIHLTAEADFQLKQMLDILNLKVAKRGIDVACLDPQEVEMTGNKAKQKILIRQTDPADGRRSSLKLSAKGYSMFDQIVPLALSLERQILGSLSPAEQTQLLAILDKLEAAELALKP